MGTLGNVLHWSTWIDAAPSARFLTDLDLKALPILADLAIGWLVHSMVLELGGRRRLALAAAAIAVLNPISWFDSVVWGQVDSVGVVFLLLALREMWRDRPERAAIFAVIAAIIKPQLGILLPIVAIVTIRRALWPAEGTGGRGTDRPADQDLDHRAGRVPDGRVRCVCRSACRSCRSAVRRRSSARACSNRSPRPPAGTRT